MPDNIKQENLIPGQDRSLWGQELFTNVSVPLDWCTARQAQELRNSHVKPAIVGNHIECDDGNEKTNYQSTKFFP